jgi:type VI secretion system protein VasJ
MTDLVEQMRVHAAQYAAPVPGPNPAGADVSYDADFEVVRVEMDKLISMSGEMPNWAEVIRQGEQLVIDKSKDMRLLVWIAAARTKRDGMLGFAQGLAGVHAVCKDHWEEMFPPIKRAKARGNLASWLGDLVMAQFAEYIPTAKDKDGFDAAETMFNEVDELLSEKLGSNYQGMGPIRTLLRDKRRMIPEPAAAAPSPAPAPQPGQMSRPEPVAAPAPAASPPLAVPQLPSLSGAGDVLPALRAVGRSIIEAAGHVRSTEPHSAWAFRLNRIGIWLTVQEPPPDEGGKTRIPPPDEADVTRLTNLSQRQQWGELVNPGEDLAWQ